MVLFISHRCTNSKVGIVSLDGAIAINFMVDPEAMPDCHKTLPEHFLSELELLAQLLGVDISAEISDARGKMKALVRVMEEASVLISSRSC